MKNITLSMPADLLKRSREYAQRHGTTLNEMVRDLLKKVVSHEKSNYLDAIEASLKELGIDTRQKFDRDELHER